MLNKNLNRVFDAIEYSNVAIENEPKNIWYLRNHAEILFLNQQYNESAKIYNQIIDLEPNNEFNYYKLADTYIYDENYLKAIKVYDNLEEKKALKNAFNAKTQALFAIKEFSKATKTLEDLSAQFPDDIEVLQILAEAYILANKQDKAMKIYEHISVKDLTMDS